MDVLGDNLMLNMTAMPSVDDYLDLVCMLREYASLCQGLDQ
jgi:hypothetical protein